MMWGWLKMNLRRNPTRSFEGVDPSCQKDFHSAEVCDLYLGSFVSRQQLEIYIDRNEATRNIYP
jgi:hypothetical protein